MFCPKCKSEYRPGFTICSDCHVPLVPELSRGALTEPEEAEIKKTMGRSNIYIRVFSRLGIFLGVMFGFLMSFRIGLLSGLIAGIIFGVISVAIIAIIYISVNYFLGNKLPPEALNVRQNIGIEVKGDGEQAFDKCVDVLQKFKFIKKLKAQKDHMIISARTKLSWTSFGENIELRVNTLEPGVIRIQISSYPAMKTTLFDFGKNFKNVEKIRKAIAHAENSMGV